MNRNSKKKASTEGANKGKPYGKDPPTKSNVEINETDTIKKFCLKSASCIITN